MARLQWTKDPVMLQIKPLDDIFLHELHKCVCGGTLIEEAACLASWLAKQGPTGGHVTGAERRAHQAHVKKGKERDNKNETEDKATAKII